MRTITKLMFTLALLVVGVGAANATKLYATYGTPASEGSWDSETQVYSWNKSYSNLMTIFTFPNGELADYTSLHLKTANYTDAYRVCFMNGGTAVATISFYSAGQKDLVLSERNETKDIDLSKITHISFGGASGSGSITIEGTPYLVKPTTIDFDETGVAMIGLTDIDYDTNLTFDDQTGEMTSNGQGTFTVTLDNEDFSSVTKVELLRSGDDIVQTLQITDADNGVLNTWYSSKYSLDFTSQQAKASKITKLSWNCNTAGTMTITGIRLTASVITANNPHYTDLTAAMFNNSYCEYHVGEAMGQGSTIYGNGNVEADRYADLAGYDALHITGTPGQDVRLLFNWGTTKNEIIQTLDENGFTSIDLTALPAQQLNAFKFQWDGKTATITSMKLYKENVSSPYSYIMSGSGVLTASALAALADETATSIDATGITKAVELEIANPNCLVVANEDMVTNEQNVIVDGTCANLVLTDGYAFAAPVGFTATNATYSTTINAEAGVGTLVLPFAASLPGGVTAFTLNFTSGDQATATAATAIEANKPVLLNGSSDAEFAASNVDIAATAEGAVNAGALNGVYAPTEITEGYVLQNGASGAGFYKVNSTKPITVKPFRAYLKAESESSRVNIVYGDSEGTGISSIDNGQLTIDNKVYDLQGRRMESSIFNSQSSIQKKGIYVRNGKKIVMK